MANIKQAFEYASKNPNSDFAKNLSQLAASGALNVEAKKNGIDLAPFQSQPQQNTEPIPDNRTSYQKGMGIGETPDQMNARNEKIASFTGGKELAQGLGQAIAQPGLSKQLDETQQQQMDIQTKLLQRIKEQKATGQDTSRLDNALKLITEDIQSTGQGADKILNQNDLTGKQVVGSALQLGANLIPGAAKGASLLTKTAAGAATGYAYDVAGGLRKDQAISEALTPGVGTVIGGSIPVVGALTKNLIIKPLSNIIKGFGSGLSGVGTKSIDDIIKNPELAKQVDTALQKEGNSKILEGQAKTIMNGVSKIKQEASDAFGQGLEQLQKTDIDNKIFKDSVQTTLDKFGSVTKDGVRDLTNVEFSDPKNIAKASELIDKLQTAKLDGKSLRKLADDIESSLYKTATSDERISFNMFVKDLSDSLKAAISESTPILGEINKKYSQDIGLADAVQSIFGDVKFKNLEELNKISQKIEGIANQKGLSPQIVEDFFNRINKSGQDFKTTEAIRQISNKVTSANTKGLTMGEITQQITSGLITPNLVKNIAILTGKTQPIIKKILETGSPVAKKALMNAIIQK